MTWRELQRSSAMQWEGYGPGYGHREVVQTQVNTIQIISHFSRQSTVYLKYNHRPSEITMFETRKHCNTPRKNSRHFTLRHSRLKAYSYGFLTTWRVCAKQQLKRGSWDSDRQLKSLSTPDRLPLPWLQLTCPKPPETTRNRRASNMLCACFWGFE